MMVQLSNVIVQIYSWFLKLFYVLDSDIRRDIFIGTTGLIVAIVIFIAEFISNQKYELNKRVLLWKSRIKENMILCISVLFIMFIFSIIKSTYTNQNEEVILIQSNELYVVLQFILNSLIAFSMYRTIRMFFVAVKINTNKEYFSRQLDEYIRNRSIQIKKELSKKQNKDYKSGAKYFQKYIEKNEIFSNELEEIGIDYTPIRSEKKGIIKSVNYRNINKLLNIMKERQLDYSNNEPAEKNKIVVYFNCNIGQKVDKNSTICYCLNGYENIFRNISDCIIYDEDTYIDDEIKCMNEDLFNMAFEYEEPRKLDENRRLYNFLSFLYKNNVECIRKDLLEKIYEEYKLFCNDYTENKRFASFLRSISHVPYNYNSSVTFDDYKKIKDCEYLLYDKRLDMPETDKKQVAYDFSFHFLGHMVFIEKNNMYYENTLSYVLRFILKLIRNNYFEEVMVVFNNLLLNTVNDNEDDFDERAILNFQFSCGVICCLVMMFKKNKIKLGDKEIIEDLINYVHRHFVGTNDAWKIVLYFKNYFEKQTAIQIVYRDLDFDCEQHKYKMSWLVHPIEETVILKNLLYLFNIHYVYDEEVDYSSVSKDDKYYYKSIIETIKSKDEFGIEKFFDKIVPMEKLISILDSAVEEADYKEQEYIKNKDLDENKVIDFERIVKKKIHEHSNLIELLKNNNKIKQSNKKLDIVFGMNQLYPKELFFRNGGGYESIAEEIGEVLQNGLEKSYISKISPIIMSKKQDVNQYISSIYNDLEDYVVISDYVSICYLKGFNREENGIIIRHKKIDVIKVAGINGIYIIKKKLLPQLNLCKFGDSFDDNNIDGNIFYEFIDCSKSEEVRLEIINATEWLKEKGGEEEQHRYLSQKCRIRAYISCEIVKDKDSDKIPNRAVKFVVNSD